MLVKPPQLLAQEKLSARMPAAMPSYSADPDRGVLTVSWVTSLNKMPISLSRENLDFPS